MTGTAHAGYGHWLRQAEACRRTTAGVKGQTARAHLLEIAARCDALAAASVPRAMFRMR